MIKEKNGIKLNIEVAGNILKYKVLGQTNEATDIIKIIGGVQDDQTGLGMKSNLYPAWAPKKKILFLRGFQSAKKNNEVVVPFRTEREAEQAVEAIDRMLDKVVAPEGIELLEHKKDMAFKPGGTSDLRTGILKKSQADFLRLTGKAYYPEERTWRGNVKPITTSNFHYSDHLGQAISVMNHAADSRYKDNRDNVGSNLHKVSFQQAQRAVELLRSSFDVAEQDDFLVAYWRLTTGLRSSDVVEDPSKITSKQIGECLRMFEEGVKKTSPDAIFTGDYSLEMDKSHIIIEGRFKIGKEIKTFKKPFDLV